MNLTIEEDPSPQKPGTRLFWVESPYQRGRNAVEVLLPPDIGPEEQLHVIYTLPVNTGTKGNWGCALEELQKHQVHMRHRVIVVAPAFDVEPWMGDLPEAPAGGAPWIRQREYLLKVVIPLIDARFPTRAEAEGRRLIGFSKSAPPALALFLQHPDLFGAVGLYDNAEPDLVDERFDTWGLAATYGTREHYLTTGPLALLQQLDPARKASPPRVVLMAGSARYEGVNKLRAALQSAGLPFVDKVFEGMEHTWQQDWLPSMADILMSME
ncbi:MAG: alpha/beta hydrolase-fold protein [Opitutales bacterium]